MLKRIIRLGFAVVAWVPSGCGGDTLISESPGPSLVSVSVVSASGTFELRVEDSVLLSVRTNIPGPFAVTWSTLDPGRLAVDQRGMVRGLAVGPAAVVVQLDFAGGLKGQGRADFTVIP